jgi:hypothetical protein
MLVVGATPALADANPCPTGTNPYFSSPTIYLGKEDGTTNIWSSQVSFAAYCATQQNPNDTSKPLAGVKVTDVDITSFAFNDLVGSADGKDPYIGLPMGVNTPLPIATTGFPSGIITNASGQAMFLLRVESPANPWLSYPDGGTRLVGLHLDIGTGMGNVQPDPIGAGLVYAATPELDSLALFGTGAAGMAGYALMRLRARGRRHD